ncbi:MAG: NrfD/PsrC family molybdoenzyme membrane anchor subunit [Adlercreutzia sp.]|nr:NrfD/PsrC family molybdoenzyme membrane anchor subunit [Adlercreutzia sp.]
MFSELIIAYLFLGGCGGGACIVIGALGLLADGLDVRRGAAFRFCDERGRKYRQFFSVLLVAAAVALVLAIACLLADLGRLDRLALLVLAPLENYLVVGAWALVVGLGLCAVHLAFWQGRWHLSLLAFRLVSGALALAGVVTTLYTGLLLSSMQAVPLWHSGWLPALFVLSSVSSGLALVLLVGAFSRSGAAFGSVLGMLTRLDALVIVAEGACVGLWLFSVWTAAGAGELLEAPLTSTAAAALRSVTALVSGEAAPWFWGGLVVAGLLVPFGVEGVALGLRVAPDRVGALLRSDSLALKASMAFSAACVLAGAVLLRFLVVSCGLPPSATYAALIL